MGLQKMLAHLYFRLYNEFDFIKKTEIIKQYTEMTHAHSCAVVGSIIYIELLLRLYHNNMLDESLKEVHELIVETFGDDHIYIKELKHYEIIFDHDFLRTPQEEIQSGGYVVHTLEAAVWCLGNTSSFRDAVLKAVNLGEDTDTVASITGTLAGMYYKMDGIPEEWLEKIVRKHDIDELIKKFYEYCANQAILEEYGGL
ncbi:ADP-ribosylglycohydrolase family protein [Bacillus changyiensis]|uniref:ADP-ribosylglycohydrolase family protein n=1 Tax=Bacillus changyiensis TaxID=3004103 RepID=UPI00293919F1|nr:ADP-ribosylglycohydrolase family protein [Bacillus changyiensis]